jgi:LysM repeat protein
VTIKNQATAGLYYYTPYTPNSPAMVNISASGDGCSAYGNRNFWRIYNFWFKKPPSFKTLVTSSRGVTMAIDQEGGVAVSRDTRSWTRPSVIPTVSSTNTVLEFGRTPDGDFAVLTAAGTAFQSEDGGQTWKSLPVERREEQQNSVVTHTVQSGDTVWRIADANSVTVASVVEQNNLASNGATIFVGQELTITKSGVVSTITSPVIPDPSIVITGGVPGGGQGETQQPSPAPESDASSTGQTPSPGEGSTESTPPAPGGQSFPALQPLVVETRESTRSYVVKRGDTLWSIARSNSTSVSRLVGLNSIANPNRLSIGQSLLVAGGQTSQQTFHRVQSGDTLPVIAVRRSLSLSELIRLNPSASESGDIRDGSLVRIS